MAEHAGVEILTIRIPMRLQRRLWKHQWGQPNGTVHAVRDRRSECAVAGPAGGDRTAGVSGIAVRPATAADTAWILTQRSD